MSNLVEAVRAASADSYFTQCKRCFMTGKACIYQREIAQALKGVPARGTRSHSAFMIMPFNSTLDEVYRAQLEPCLLSIDLLDRVQRADDVARTGYVICEKICKQIQLSDVVCAEMSCDNPNVFYELGLAYALDRNVALFLQRSIEGKRDGFRKKLNLTQDQYNLYDPFDMLTSPALKLWNKSKYKAAPAPRNEGVVVLLADTRDFEEIVNGQRLSYTVDGLCRGAIHRTLDRLGRDEISPWGIDERTTVVLKRDGYFQDSKEVTFRDVKERVRNAAYVIMVTHRDEPCSYFWLGFAHGLEKDVVPITVTMPSPHGTEPPTPVDQLPESSSAVIVPETLPFDMRALWHITFPHNKPIDLEEQLSSILTIVCNRNRDKLHRAKFWQPFLEGGSVSIFVGSVELTGKQRHVIGEWDYRTVAELTSFFASTKETMEIAIQPPAFQASSLFSKPGATTNRQNYVAELIEKLRSSDCIVLASADVNDMTEVALAEYAGVEPFQAGLWKTAGFNGIVGFKSKGDEAFPTPSVYLQCVDEDGPGGGRGFYDIAGGGAHDQRTWSSISRKYSEKNDEGFAVYYSHIAKLRLPESNHWTVVLQGITGPATLGLAQALTGGTNEQFTIFNSSIDDQRRSYVLDQVAKQSESPRAARESVEDGKLTPAMFHAHSEKLADSLNQECRSDHAVEAIVRIYLMDGPMEDGGEQHDERKIIWWDTVMEPRQMPRSR